MTPDGIVGDRFGGTDSRRQAFELYRPPVEIDAVEALLLHTRARCVTLDTSMVVFVSENPALGNCRYTANLLD
jgi:hypothetical protein